MNIPFLVIAGLAVAGGGFLALRRFESMRRKSADQLRAILRGPEWTFYRNALVELQRRGENIEAEVVPILHLLISDTRIPREGGWMILQELYPELAARAPDYNPKETTDVCRKKMQKILLEAASDKRGA